MHILLLSNSANFCFLIIPLSFVNSLLFLSVWWIPYYSSQDVEPFAAVRRLVAPPPILLISPQGTPWSETEYSPLWLALVRGWMLLWLVVMACTVECCYGLHCWNVLSLVHIDIWYYRHILWSNKLQAALFWDISFLIDLIHHLTLLSLSFSPPPPFPPPPRIFLPSKLLLIHHFTINSRRSRSSCYQPLQSPGSEGSRH